LCCACAIGGEFRGKFRTLQVTKKVQPQAGRDAVLFAAPVQRCAFVQNRRESSAFFLSPQTKKQNRMRAISLVACASALWQATNARGLFDRRACGVCVCAQAPGSDGCVPVSMRAQNNVRACIEGVDAIVDGAADLLARNSFARMAAL
jgi:hypothetical protein